MKPSPDNPENPKGLLSGPAYEPPYDGAVQDEFAWHLVKYLHPDAVVQSEVEIETKAALFAVDFVVTLDTERTPETEAGVRRIGFECGGGRNLRDHQRRLRRDATIIGSTGPDGKPLLDALYRLRGSDLLDHMEDCLYLIQQWETGAPVNVFSEKGRAQLHKLASREALDLRLRPEQAAAMVLYEIDPEQEEYFSERHLWHAANGTKPFILLRRFDRDYPDAWSVHVIEPPRLAGSQSSGGATDGAVSDDGAPASEDAS